jgi:hypothetical protein
LSTSINISWTAACGSVDNSVVFGPLGDVSTYGYSGEECSIGNTGSHSFDPGSGSFFFVVVGNDGSTIEGSYGTNHAGTERPTHPGCGLSQVLNLRCD